RGPKIPKFAPERDPSTGELRNRTTRWGSGRAGFKPACRNSGCLAVTTTRADSAIPTRGDMAGNTHGGNTRTPRIRGDSTAGSMRRADSTGDKTRKVDNSTADRHRP